MQEAGQYYRFRPDEIFRRITITSLVNLMLEQSKLEIQEKDEHLASQNGGNSSPEDSSSQSHSAPSTQRLISFAYLYNLGYPRTITYMMRV